MDIQAMQEKLRRMTEETTVSIGLDIGSYRSVIGYQRGDNPPDAIFDLRSADLHTRGGVPSLVWIKKDGTILAGGAVEKAHALEIDPDGVCESPKMKLHEDAIMLHGKPYAPEELLRILLENIRDTGREELSRRNITHFSKMVAGRPNRYQGDEIGTLKKLLQKVYPGVSIRLVSESILAAISYRIYTMDADRPLLVFDLGAGTFDVCYLTKNRNPTRLEPYPFRVGKTIDGSRFAGNEIDRLTRDLILEQLEREYAASELKTIRQEGHADHAMLLYKARELKETLSYAETERVTLTTVGGRTFTTIVSRARFEKKIAAKLQKNVDLAAAVLQAENPGTPDVDVLMVGASCYIPLVKKLLQKKFHWLSEERFLLREPEKAVALGAAICCSLPDFVDSSPVAYAYSVMTYSVQNRREMLHVRIPSGAKLPCTTQAFYATRFENQKNIAFQVYELESGRRDEMVRVEDGSPTEYTVVHEFGREMPKGTEVQVTVSLDENGVLTLKVDDMGKTGREPTVLVVTIPNSTHA